MSYCQHSNQDRFPFKLPELPYSKDAFIPHFSPETFDYHYGKHHNAYVINLNKLLENNKAMHETNLEQIIKISHGSNSAVFNNAAQIWNHSFFWNSIKPSGGGKPTGVMLEKINQDFGSYNDFLTHFKDAAITQFGSGWAWLVLNDHNKLEIIKTANADTPLIYGLSPLITCDVWEHAYYIDYRNKRPDYVSIFLSHMINWDFASLHLQKSTR